MEQDRKKATLIPIVAAKDRGATNFTRHLHGGHLVRTSSDTHGLLLKRKSKRPWVSDDVFARQYDNQV